VTRSMPPIRARAGCDRSGKGRTRRSTVREKVTFWRRRRRHSRSANASPAEPPAPSLNAEQSAESTEPTASPAAPDGGRAASAAANSQQGIYELKTARQHPGGSVWRSKARPLIPS